MIELGLKGNWYLISWFAYLIKFVWTTCTLSETSGSLVCLPFCMQGYSMGALSVVGAGLLHRTITMNILLWQMSLPWVTSRENETELRPQIRTVFFFLYSLVYVLFQWWQYGLSISLHSTSCAERWELLCLVPMV